MSIFSIDYLIFSGDKLFMS